MIQIKNLTITNDKDLRDIINDFSLVLNDFDKAVIIGEEGNGKSTLLKWIYDPSLLDSYCQYHGEKVFNNAKLGYLSQELSINDVEKSIYEYFCSEEMFFDKSANELANLAIRFDVPIDIYYENKKMNSLSGGEKIKLQLMRLLLANPDVLLLDEPSNDLDLQTLNVLEEVIRDFEHIVIFVSHDEILIEKVANVIIHLEQINHKSKSRYTIFKGDYKTYVEERLNSFDKQRQQAISDLREKKLRDQRYQRVLNSVDRALNTVSRQSPLEARNLKDKMHTVKAMGKRFAREDENMTKMPQQEEAIFLTLGSNETSIPEGKMVIDFHLDELKSIDNTKLLARNINFTIKGPKKICLIGKNGVGKTTLLKKVYDNLKTRNDIIVDYMPQNYNDLLDENKTPIEFLAPNRDKESVTWVRTCLGSMKYTSDEMEHAIKELSGGQKAKLFLLKMSLSKANVLILDEPTRNFSPLSGPVIRKLVKDFSGTVISVSHDRKFIYEVSDEVYLLTNNGLERIDIAD